MSIDAQDNASKLITKAAQFNLTPDGNNTSQLYSIDLAQKVIATIELITSSAAPKLKTQYDLLITDLLNDFKQFKGLRNFIKYNAIDDSIVKQTLKLFRYQRVDNDTTLFKEFELANRCYFLLKGSVSIRRKEKVEHCYRDKEVMRVRQGHIFGEWSSSIATKRSYSAVTVTDCQLLYLNRDDYVVTLGKCLLNADVNRREFLIKTIPFFKTINQSIVEDILRKNVKAEFYTRNEIIFQENERSGSIYLIYKGEGRIMTNVAKSFTSVFPIEKTESESLIKHCLIDYKQFFKEELKEIEENGEKEHLINIKELTTILKLSAGDIAGSEVCAGIDRMRYTLVASDYFTAVLVLNLEHLPEFREQICKSLLPLFILKEQLLEASLKKIKLLAQSLDRKFESHYNTNYSSPKSTVNQPTKNSLGFEKTKAGFIKQTLHNANRFREVEKKIMESKLSLHLSKSIGNYLNRIHTPQVRAKEVKMLHSNYAKASLPVDKTTFSLSSSSSCLLLNRQVKGSTPNNNKENCSAPMTISFKPMKSPQQRLNQSAKSRLKFGTIDKSKWMLKDTKETEANSELNQSQKNLLKGNQGYNSFFHVLDDSIRKTLNPKMEPILSFYTGSYDLPFASMCK